jgi:predicted phage-related endonuclease
MLRYKKSSYNACNATEAMRYGLNMEEYIFKEVVKKFDCPVRKCGFMIHPEYDFIGASPDGLVGDDSVLEIKCLHTLRGQDKRPEWLIVDNGLYRLQPSHKYYYQIQGEMMCAEKKFCVLIVYHQMAKGCRMYTVFVDRDQTFIDKMTKDLVIFWLRYYQSPSP